MERAGNNLEQGSIKKVKDPLLPSFAQLKHLALFAALVREIVPWLNLKYECDYGTQI